jgi:hypothetical protein
MVKEGFGYRYPRDENRIEGYDHRKWSPHGHIDSYMKSYSDRDVKPGQPGEDEYQNESPFKQDCHP